MAQLSKGFVKEKPALQEPLLGLENGTGVDDRPLLSSETMPSASSLPASLATGISPSIAKESLRLSPWLGALRRASASKR